MQRQTLLVAAALTAAAATALWLWPIRAPAPAPMSSQTAPAPVRAVAVAEPPAPASAATASEVPRPPTTSAPEPAPEPKPKTAPPAPAPATPAPPDRATATPAANPAPASSEPATVPGEVAVESATSDAAGPDASALDEAVDDETAVDAAAAAPAIDEDQAIDLFAERMTALEQAGDGDPNAADARRQKAFDARDDGGDEAATRTRELRAHLQAWIDGLAPDHPHDVLLASVECRAGGCRVLVAEGGVDLSGQAEAPGGADVNALQASFLALRATDWWPRLQLGDASLSMHAADAAVAPGYVLWTIYVGVTAESAASEPGA